MSELQPGIAGESKMTVAVGNTAIEVGSGSVPVFATPMLVALMENAAINALAGKLAEGMSSVGTKVEVAHTAATPLGMTVTARAELLEVDGKRLLFKVTAVDEAGPVGEGRHERFIIDLGKFFDRVEAKKKSQGL
jgi:predicted thioesterase